MNKAQLSISDVAERRILRSLFGYALLFASLCFFAHFGFGLATKTLDRRASVLVPFLAVWALPVIVVLLAKPWVKWRSRPSALMEGQVLPFASTNERSRLLAQRWSLRSLALPIAGLSLMLPISIHFLVLLCLGEQEMARWIGSTMVIVGHAHIALVLYGFHYAKRRTQGKPVSNPGFAAWLLAVSVAAIPGAILIMIPPVLVGVTGFFIPIMYRIFDKAWAREEGAYAKATSSKA